MGVTTEMSFIFKRERHARWAAHMVEGIIKVALAEGTELDESLGLSHYDRLMDAFFSHEEGLRGFDPVENDPRCALVWMHRRGTRVVVERCADIQVTFPLRPEALGDEPFPQICLACATRLPQVPFTAYCRNEQTTSGAVQLTRVSWNGERIRFRQLYGLLPFDERAWDTWSMLDLRLCDGKFVACETVSPLERHYRELLDEAREASEAGDMAGALYFADAAEALPGCKDRFEAALQRGLACEHLQRSGIRRVMQLWSRDVPKELSDELDEASPVVEMPLGGGRFRLQVQELGFDIVDTRDGSVVAEQREVWSRGPTYIVHDFLVRSGDCHFLIDWEYVAQVPLANMW